LTRSDVNDLHRLKELFQSGNVLAGACGLLETVEEFSGNECGDGEFSGVILHRLGNSRIAVEVSDADIGVQQHHGILTSRPL
jgi:hypothetical protein